MGGVRKSPTRATLPIRVWLIDDTQEHHDAADLTTAGLAGVDLEHFFSGAEALAEYGERALSNETLPDIILMDFYLDGERGDRITREFRICETANHRPVIVGYSSMVNGSAAIVAAGADLSVQKVKTSGGNPFLAEYLRVVLAARKG